MGEVIQTGAKLAGSTMSPASMFAKRQYVQWQGQRGRCHLYQTCNVERNCSRQATGCERTYQKEGAITMKTETSSNEVQIETRSGSGVSSGPSCNPSKCEKSLTCMADPTKCAPEGVWLACPTNER